MNVMGLLDYLQEEVEDAAKVPFTENCMIDRQKMLNIIQDIRVTLPNELMKAETIRNQRNQILEDAEQEARSIIDEAEQRAAQMVEENAITQEAYDKAQQILDSAQVGAEEVRNSANTYVEEILADLENYVKHSLELVQTSIAQMQGR